MLVVDKPDRCQISSQQWLAARHYRYNATHLSVYPLTPFAQLPCLAYHSSTTHPVHLRR